MTKTKKKKKAAADAAAAAKAATRARREAKKANAAAMAPELSLKSNRERKITAKHKSHPKPAKNRMTEPNLMATDDQEADSAPVSNPSHLSLVGTDDQASVDENPNLEKEEKAKLKQAMRLEYENSHLGIAMREAFDSRRALIIRTERHKQNARRNLSHADSTQAFVAFVRSCPEVAGAWTNPFTEKGRHAILCLFNQAKDAIEAEQAWNEQNIKFKWQGSRFPLKASADIASDQLWRLVKVIDPTKAEPPRSPAAARSRTPIIASNSVAEPRAQSPEEHRSTAASTGSASFPNNGTNSVSTQPHNTVMVSASSNLVSPKIGSTVSDSLIGRNGHIKGNAAVARIQHLSHSQQEPIASDYGQLDGSADLDTETTNPPIATESEDLRLDALALLQMELEDQSDIQGRYLGEVNSVPKFGCIICGDWDHLFAACPSRKCAYCGEEDSHLSASCRKRPSVTKAPNRGYTCDTCRAEGYREDMCSHVWRQVFPERGQNLGKVSLLNTWCYACGQHGHWGGDCPDRGRDSDNVYDCFSNKEASKYLDASAPPASVLTPANHILRSKVVQDGLATRIEAVQAPRRSNDGYVQYQPWAQRQANPQLGSRSRRGSSPPPPPPSTEPPPLPPPPPRSLYSTVYGHLGFYHGGPPVTAWAGSSGGYQNNTNAASYAQAVPAPPPPVATNYGQHRTYAAAPPPSYTWSGYGQTQPYNSLYPQPFSTGAGYSSQQPPNAPPNSQGPPGSQVPPASGYWDRATRDGRQSYRGGGRGHY